jgi:hypothetical protein
LGFVSCHIRTMDRAAEETTWRDNQLSTQHPGWAQPTPDRFTVTKVTLADQQHRGPAEPSLGCNIKAKNKVAVMLTHCILGQFVTWQ